MANCSKDVFDCKELGQEVPLEGAVVQGCLVGGCVGSADVGKCDGGVVHVASAEFHLPGLVERRLEVCEVLDHLEGVSPPPLHAPHVLVVAPAEGHQVAGVAAPLVVAEVRGLHVLVAAVQQRDDDPADGGGGASPGAAPEAQVAVRPAAARASVVVLAHPAPRLRGHRLPALPARLVEDVGRGGVVQCRLCDAQLVLHLLPQLHGVACGAVAL